METLELFKKKKKVLKEGAVPSGYIKHSQTGVLYPRVTSVTKVIDKPWLVQFYLEHGEQEAERRTDEAADIGTEAHQAIEVYIRSLGKTCSDKLPIGFLQFFKEEAIDLTQPFLCEERLFSDELGVCGKPDLIAHTKYGIGVYDWKTSKDVYPDYAIQMAYYYQLARESGWNIHFGCVVKFPKPSEVLKKIPYTRIPSMVLDKVLLPVAKSCMSIFVWQKSFKMNKERLAI